MRHQDQVAEIHKLLSHLEARTTAMADSAYRNPLATISAHSRPSLERETFFRRGPIVIGLGRLLPIRGDYMTHDYTGSANTAG